MGGQVLLACDACVGESSKDSVGWELLSVPPIGEPGGASNKAKVV